MRIQSKIVASLVAMLACGSAFATEEDNKTIQSVGVQSGGPSYVVFNEPLAVGCQFTLIYLPAQSTDSGKQMLAVLLSAQAAGKGVARIIYSQDTSGNCTASLISVGP